MSTLTDAARPTWTTPGRLAADLTGTRLDPHPHVAHCSTCGSRRDEPSWLPGCAAHPHGPALPALRRCVANEQTCLNMARRGELCCALHEDRATYERYLAADTVARRLTRRGSA